MCVLQDFTILLNKCATVPLLVGLDLLRVSGGVKPLKRFQPTLHAFDSETVF
jgi:hypothetical protein